MAWATAFTLKPHESSEARELADGAVSAYLARTGGALASDELGGVADVPKTLWSSDLAFLVINAKAEVGFVNAKVLIWGVDGWYS